VTRWLRILSSSDWAQGTRMWIAGIGYKAGRFTNVGNVALSPPPDTDTDTDTSPRRRSLAQ
jgi:hypothetical protein